MREGMRKWNESEPLLIAFLFLQSSRSKKEGSPRRSRRRRNGATSLRASPRRIPKINPSNRLLKSRKKRLEIYRNGADLKQVIGIPFLFLFDCVVGGVFNKLRPRDGERMGW